MGEARYAVLDVETTGVYPTRDRTIEVAVVRLSATAELIDEFVTLVNPHRDVGPTDLHGITAADVKAAPDFGDVAGDILERLSGLTWVGHNVRFDRSFVLAEYERIGVAIPIPPSLCTLRISHRLAPGIPNHRLSNCCAHFGVPLQEAHSALGDARATAGLLRRCMEDLQVIEGPGALAEVLESPPPPTIPWPRLPSLRKALPRLEARRRRDEEVPLISDLVRRLPTVAGGADVAAYLNVLDRVLEDRHVAEEEVDALLQVATEWGLSEDRARQAHEAYLEGLVRLAFADGVLTDMERTDLKVVTRLLALEPLVLERLVAETRSAGTTAPERPEPGTPPAGPSGNALAGKSVCFTGALTGTYRGQSLTRELVEALASNAGLLVSRGVTKKLDILVVADPDSMSGKAKKARDYGTRILAAPVFLASIGASLD